MCRKSSLLRLVNNLASQDRIPDEVIIVEAGGIGWTEDMVPKQLHLEYIFIDAKGSSLAEARDIGRINADGEILIFLDDDVVLPTNYVSEALKALENCDGTMGVGGTYRDSAPATRKYWKTAIGRLLGIYSNGRQNKILRSGWADYVRGPYADKVTSADWLFGCNWAIKARAFQNEKVTIETNLARWSFLEDVILGHRLVSAYGDCLKILPNLEVLHDPITTSGAITPETVRMRIVYRYVFWRYELCNNISRHQFSYCLGMFANTILMLMQRPTLNVLYECISSYYYIMKTPPSSYQECNIFIFRH